MWWVSIMWEWVLSASASYNTSLHTCLRYIGFSLYVHWGNVVVGHQIHLQNMKKTQLVNQSDLLWFLGLGYILVSCYWASTTSLVARISMTAFMKILFHGITTLNITKVYRTYHSLWVPLLGQVEGGVCVFSPRLHGVSAGTPASTHSLKTFMFRATGNSKVPQEVSVNVFLSCN